MRYLLVCCAVSAAIVAGFANAQAPRELVAADTIELRAEQTRTFAFDEPVTKFTLSSEGVAQVIPETDRTFTVRALTPGRVLMTAYAPDGHVVHRSNIVVGQTEGLVKIYGLKDAKDSEAKDFLGFYCSNTGCGRADPDKIPVSQTRQRSGGNSEATKDEQR
ncbi:pilus assembly protein N-terminal domain-containing protein [Bradyrhizobium manausense]|uniref:pilus assembly protein N-terminal domain-containing protein n=1 Tax=Bradyrhizobium manausense TaxID=989370 RepID=UPI001BA63620|nr:pilus assembly protein N-terminal domain-containing protein [Bradyrhizobium manausense]MBR0690074.1 pilus assembly protein N-terminal domain-containing protein [Bradyrhizobium manausense]MBR0722602.1 pilus assembly protein N-terminal domain-containing protein [Bradyrhizobium manausense]MBR0832253.1 pilus assembly protein N-terminal domain-containing protein [Bradyrhizobium manausense]